MNRGDCHALQPGTEATVFAGRQGVYQTAHSYIGECVYKTGYQEQNAYHCSRNTQYVGVELHQVTAGENECEVVGEVSEQVAYFVADAERPRRSIGIVCHNVVSFSQDSIFGRTCLVRLPNEFRIPFLNHKREDLFY